MISERTLRKWRIESLKRSNNPLWIHSSTGEPIPVKLDRELNERILRLTQELLDQYWMKKD